MTKVNREQFLASLELVQAGLSPREIIEQSNCLLFRGGKVHSFNDEISCRAPSPLPENFTGAVPAVKLLELLRRLTEEEIEIRPGMGELVLVGKRRKAGIRYEATVADHFKVVEKPKEWTVLPAEFLEAVALVGSCASRDASRFEATCVHLHPKWVEASDNIQLCRWPLRTGLKEPTLVRQSALKHMATLNVAEFCVTDSWLHFRNAHGLVISCRRYLDEYPDLTSLLKVDGTPTILPKGLVDACDKARLFSTENVDMDVVQLELSAGKLRLRGEGVSGWYSEVKKLNYNGVGMSFYIPPQVLIDLVKRHNECVISEDHLKVDGGKYIYLTCLVRPGEHGGNGGDTDEGSGDD